MKVRYSRHPVGGKPRKSFDPDDPRAWRTLGTAGGLLVEHNEIGAVRLSVPDTDSHWVLLPWEVAPLAVLLSKLLRGK